MILSAASSFQNGLFLLLGVVGLTFYSLVLLRRNRKHSDTTNRRMRDQFSELRAHSQLRGSMEELLLRLEEVSRRTNAQLDTKFARLEAVVRDADDRIGRLERLVAAAGVAANRAAAEEGNLASAPPTADSGGDAAGAGDPGRGSAPAVRPSEHRGQPVPAREADSRVPADVRRIRELADGGLTPIKIAERLGLPLGEVELVLNLRRGG